MKIIMLGERIQYRLMRLAPAILLFLLIVGCGSNPETAVVGTWKLKLDAVRFEPSEATKKQLGNQPMGEMAIQELEKQIRGQLQAKIGNGSWEFKADKTVTITTATETTTGTWSISDREVTLKPQIGPEAKMVLSSDGKQLESRSATEQGAIVLVLVKS
jgi:hypothetical protein